MVQNPNKQLPAAITVKNVSKNFILPHERKQSVKQAFTGLLKNKPSKGKYEIQHALRDISFDVRQGEFFGILGRNGSGKSTLLKILAEIYRPTNGRVRTKGKLVPFIELGVGFNPELTGRENVYLNGAMLGFSKAQIDAKYHDIVAFAELEDFMDQKLKNYSSGMQVRLAFSVATQAEADILLIDEVLAVGDADFQRKCFNYFKELKKGQKTVIFVTHSMDAVREYCDKAILINESRLVYEGSADNAADEYLKLFNKGTGESVVSENRWGNGQVSFDNVQLSKKEDALEITARLACGDKPVEDVVTGFRVLDNEGKVVAGINSLNASGGKNLSFKANEVKTLRFKLMNIFGSGLFRVSGTIRLSDKVTICDDWSDITTFQDTKAGSPYPIVCPATVEIE